LFDGRWESKTNGKLFEKILCNNRVDNAIVLIATVYDETLAKTPAGEKIK